MPTAPASLPSAMRSACRSANRSAVPSGRIWTPTVMRPPVPITAAVDADPDDRWFRLPDLARYSSLSLRTLHRLKNERLDPLPVVYFGRVPLVQKSQFDAWLRGREQRAAEIAALGPDVLTDVRRAAL